MSGPPSMRTEFFMRLHIHRTINRAVRKAAQGIANIIDRQILEDVRKQAGRPNEKYESDLKFV